MAENRLQKVQDFVRSVDADLHRAFDFEVEEVRDSGSGGGQYTILGHAAVFNRWSLDLGGFRERIKKGAFDDVLSRDPHVLHTWDHDTAKVLSSTRNKTLELSIDPKGLRYWSKVAPTSYAADLRVLLERNDINQSSFAFTVAKDEWVIREDDDNEVVERTIVQVGELFDVTTCAMGAYPATDADLALRTLLAKDKRGWADAVTYSEKRADMESVACLMQMYQLAQEFLQDEDQPDDAPDRAAMQRILSELEGLVEAEASEPNDEGSEMEENSRPRGAVTVRRADEAGAAPGEIARLRREAEAAALIARERLYRRVAP